MGSLPLGFNPCFNGTTFATLSILLAFCIAIDDWVFTISDASCLITFTMLHGSWTYFMVNSGLFLEHLLIASGYIMMYLFKFFWVMSADVEKNN